MMFCVPAAGVLVPELAVFSNVDVLAPSLSIWNDGFFRLIVFHLSFGGVVLAGYVRIGVSWKHSGVTKCVPCVVSCHLTPNHTLVVYPQSLEHRQIYIPTSYIPLFATPRCDRGKKRVISPSAFAFALSRHTRRVNALRALQ